MRNLLLYVALPFLVTVSFSSSGSVENSNQNRTHSSVKSEVPVYYNFASEKKEPLDLNVTYEKGKNFLPAHPEVINVYDALIDDGITPFEAVTSTYVFMGSLLSE